MQRVAGLAPPGQGVMMSKSGAEALTWDVLVYMVTFLPRQDVSRFMKTCRAFHAVGLRQLFHDPIQLRGDNILSFYCCILHDSASQRALYIRELIISCSLSRPRPLPNDYGLGTRPMPMAELLTAILSNVRHLRRLELDWAAAGFSAYLRDSMPALSRLEELRIPYLSQSLWDDLKNIRAPLRRLSIQLGPMQGSSVVDPVPLLERFSSTLQEVHLSGVQLQDSVPEYREVRKLSLSDCYFEFLLGGIDAAPVSRAFPNVEDLSFSAARVHPEASQWIEGRSCDKPELIERCRRTNKHRLAQTCGWTQLERVSVGHVVDAYMLGLDRHIPRVEIQMLSEATIYMLQDVLRDTRPSSLSLALFALDRVLDCIPRLFSAGDCADGLSHFALSLRCTKPAVDVDKLIANLSALLAPLRVERLSIRLERWDTVGMYYLPEHDLRPIDLCLEGVFSQADDLARRVMREVPSVRNVSVGIKYGKVERAASTSADPTRN